MIGITTEAANIFLSQLESMTDIPDSSVGGFALMQEGKAVGETSKTEPLVVGDEDEFPRQIKETFRDVL